MKQSTEPSHLIRRLKSPIRNQIEMRFAALDDMLPPDHKARFVWSFVEQLNLSNVLCNIRSIDGMAGRPATDPKILLAIWLYATIEGIVSARTISDYCKEHIPFQWLCGGVGMNYHTISDFATCNAEQFDEWLTESVAILMQKGMVDLEEIAQDGVRVRANAGGSSFRREKTLSKYHQEAKQYLTKLREELKKDPSQGRSRKRTASERAAKEREEGVAKAIEELKKLREEKIKSLKKHRKKAKEEDLEKIRASTTDPEARVMKMACGGFRPAYNVQFSTDTRGRAIVGVEISNRGNDTGLIVPMLAQIKQRYGVVPKRCLEDAGYTDFAEIERAAELYGDCKIYMPIRNTKGKSDLVKPEDSRAVADWKKRMLSEEGKEIYKRRSSAAEWSNAQARNRGLQRFLVRSVRRVRQVALRFALAHNMQRLFAFQLSGC